MTFVYKPKRFFLQQVKFVTVCVQFLLLIPMLIDNSENVALLNCYIKFVKGTRQLHRFVPEPLGKLLVYNTSLQASPPTE